MLSHQLTQEITELLSLLPDIHDTPGQRAFVGRAGLDQRLQTQITYARAPGEFVQLLVTRLENYETLEDGRDALEAILETAKDYWGQEKQERCDVLIQELRKFRQEQQCNTEKEVNSPKASRPDEEKTPGTEEQDFLYDVYISYAEQKPDETWVWDTLLPRLQEAGLRVAISEDVWKPGVDRVVNISRGIKQAKYILLVLSEAYLADKWIRVEHIMGETKGVQENTYRIIPLKFIPIDESKMPDWIGGKWTVDFTDSRRVERRFKTLVNQLRESLPQRVEK